ncbi:DUF305 domain-containing protein [Massilia sp. TWR1-2-2]|uniref:DUF305 domain-containing protein n=1 Tax=Massilia sp. TWR1-2-2 TaxID=2804584 RepID=UPI003CF72E54
MTLTTNRRFLSTTAAKLILSAAVSAGALAVAGPALAQSAGHAQHDMSKPAHAAGKTSMPMHASMDEMQKKMKNMAMTGNQDMDFAMMMVGHHQGAIDMAQAQIEHGKDKQMISAAKKIIAAQKKEIAMFEAWMKKHPHPAK